MTGVFFDWGVTPMSAVAVLTLVLAIRSFYHLVLHPLAKIPGPKVYALSDIPFLFHLLRGEWPFVLKNLHDQYGPVVRYSPRDVSIITVDGWKKIYGHKNDSAKNFEKDHLLYGKPSSGHHTIMTAKNEDHKRMRRLLSHAFSETALRNQETVMKSYIDLFISRMTEKAKAKDTINLVQWFNFTTFDLIGDLTFGEPFGCLEKETYHPWVSMIFSSVRFTVFLQLMLRYPSLQILATLFVPQRVKKAHEEHWRLSEQTALRRLDTMGTEREDFMSYILRQNSGEGMTRGEIVENSNVLIIAGSETTATQLSGTTFQLLTNSKVYNKLVWEIRTAFTSEEEITLVRVNELKYMRAVFEEGFRMYPPVPVGLPRTVCQGGEWIQGYYIPQDTGVSVPQWSAYQSESNWLEPEKFVPERWLGDVRFEHDNRDVLQPFSYGPRNCIGKNLAYAEMRLILTRLLWKFDLEMMDESKSWAKQKIFTLWDKKELRVKLQEVERV